MTGHQECSHYHWHVWDRSTDVTITQTIFAWFASHLGHFPHLGRPLDALHLASPTRYSSATSFPLTIISYYRYDPMSKFKFFSKDPSWLEESFTSLCGTLGHMSTIKPIFIWPPYYTQNSPRSQALGLGETQKSFAGTSPTYLSLLEMRQHQIECMASLQCG